MATPYDYVQIVADDDWGLVGIVPPGGIGERIKNMSVNKKEEGKKGEGKKEEEKKKVKGKIITNNEIQVTTGVVTGVVTSKEIGKVNQNTLKGIEKRKNEEVITEAYEKFPEMFGNMVNNSAVRVRENLLVGFGK